MSGTRYSGVDSDKRCNQCGGPVQWHSTGFGDPVTEVMCQACDAANYLAARHDDKFVWVVTIQDSDAKGHTKAAVFDNLKSACTTFDAAIAEFGADAAMHSLKIETEPRAFWNDADN